jgi:hypothetical protein
MVSREESIAYWSQRNPWRCFKEFLLCHYRMVKQGDILKMPSDMRKLLFYYFQKYIQFHKKKSSGSKCIDIVTPINFIIPEGTMKCIHISGRKLGREIFHYRLAFKIQDPRILHRLVEFETNIKQSLEFETNISLEFETNISLEFETNKNWKSMLKESTLFYTMHGECPREYFEESRSSDLFRDYTKVQSDGSLFQIGCMVDFPLNFLIKGVVGKSHWTVQFSLERYKK